MFHSISYGLGSRYNARMIRKEICSFIKNNPDFRVSVALLELQYYCTEFIDIRGVMYFVQICETPLRDWVKWDSGTNCASYASRMSGGAWGGGIEMACASQIYKVNIHVYEKHGMMTSLYSIDPFGGVYAYWCLSPGGGFRRISAFDFPDRPESRNIVRIVYQGGVHYGEFGVTGTHCFSDW
jgi:hypothetical protein